MRGLFNLLFNIFFTASFCLVFRHITNLARLYNFSDNIRQHFTEKTILNIQSSYSSRYLMKCTFFVYCFKFCKISCTTIFSKVLQHPLQLMLYLGLTESGYYTVYDFELKSRRNNSKSLFCFPVCKAISVYGMALSFCPSVYLTVIFWLTFALKVLDLLFLPIG